MEATTKIRVRFAPSPTGYLHVGGLRTALYDYLFAKKNGGDFILKIEDTDQKRYVEGSVEGLIKSLDWMGLARNEGVSLSAENENKKIAATESKTYRGVFEAGEYGPYIQSEKLETYKKYIDQLVKNNHAYYCFCDSERLEKMREEQSAQKKAPMYDRHCLKLSQEEIENNLKNKKPFVIRMKISKDEIIEAEDIVHGKVSFDMNLIDDQVLLKSDGFPTYHLASVIDDYEMKITHVIRGDEWLPSLPKHLSLYRYFGWQPPKFAHLPLLLNPDKSKLSKRQGDVAVEDYIKKGYLKEAIINFVALLGWNPGAGETQEIFTLEELVEKFDFAKVHKAGAVFDLKKLDWINSQWIKKNSLDDLYKKTLPFFAQKDFFINTPEDKKSENYLKKVLTVERERLAKLSDVGEENKFFFQDISYDKNLLRWKEMDDEALKKTLEKSQEILKNITDENWTRENLEKELINVAGDKKGELLWPLRAALTGAQKSPSPFEVAWVLGKTESLKRIEKALFL